MRTKGKRIIFIEQDLTMLFGTYLTTMVAIATDEDVAIEAAMSLNENEDVLSSQLIVKRNRLTVVDLGPAPDEFASEPTWRHRDTLVIAIGVGYDDARYPTENDDG